MERVRTEENLEENKTIFLLVYVPACCGQRSISNVSPQELTTWFLRQGLLLGVEVPLGT